MEWIIRNNTLIQQYESLKRLIPVCMFSNNWHVNAISSGQQPSHKLQYVQYSSPGRYTSNERNGINKYPPDIYLTVLHIDTIISAISFVDISNYIIVYLNSCEVVD